jgi:hypothetical protein
MKASPTATQIMTMRKATGMPVHSAKEFLESQPPELIERVLNSALLFGRIPHLKAFDGCDEMLIDRTFRAIECADSDGRLIDPQHFDSKVGPIIDRILDEETSKLESEHGLGMGSCHLIWNRSKKRLQTDFNINWYSPAELNLGICFD